MFKRMLSQNLLLTMVLKSAVKKVIIRGVVARRPVFSVSFFLLELSVLHLKPHGLF